MERKESQIKELESLINEGIMSQNLALEGKKYYLKKVQEWMGNNCKENNEEVPDWIYALQTEVVKINNETQSNTKDEFVSKQLVYCLQLLKDIRSVYYAQKQLEESRHQTERLCRANWISFAAFLVTLLATSIVIQLINKGKMMVVRKR